MIVFHNHPGGSLKPSKAGKALTEKLRAVGELMEIKLIDHIILTAESHFCFADYGLL